MAERFYAGRHPTERKLLSGEYSGTGICPLPYVVSGAWVYVNGYIFPPPPLRTQNPIERGAEWHLPRPVRSDRQIHVRISDPGLTE